MDSQCLPFFQGKSHSSEKARISDEINPRYGGWTSVVIMFVLINNLRQRNISTSG